MDFGLIITLLLLLMCRLKFCHFDPTGRTRVARSGGRRQCCHPDGKSHRLTREEEENLADYLNLGMSIDEAKEAFRVELEAAELRLKVRENKRARQAG